MRVSFGKLIKTLLLLLLIFHQVKGISQTPFFSEALVITNSQDTIQGFIKKENERKLGIEIHFKKDIKSSETQIYHAGEILGYKFLDDKREFRTISIENGLGNGEQESKRFGKLMLEGYCELYKVILFPEEYEKVFISNQYIYVVKKDKEWLRLEETEQQVEIADYVLRKKYLGVLKYMANDCNDRSLKEKEPAFKDQEIVDYIKRYNKCKAPEERQVELSHSVKTQLRHYIPITYLRPFKKEYIPQGEIYNSIQIYGIGYFMNIYDPSLHKAISANFGFTYYEAILQGKSGTERRSDYDIYWSLNYMLSKTKTRPFLTIGSRIATFRLLYGGGLDIGNVRVFINLESISLNPIKHTDYVEVGIALNIFKNFKERNSR